MKNITSPLRQFRRLATYTLAAVAATGSSLTILSYFVVRTITKPNKVEANPPHNFTPFEFGIDFQKVSFSPAKGDHKVHGWFLPRETSQNVIIVCAGFRSSMVDLLGISTYLWRDGFNVLLFDYHGHGADAGSPVTLGYRELNDFLGAVDWVHATMPDAHIGVVGYSMGAAIAIMGTARRKEVEVIIADSPFARHRDVVEHGFHNVTRLPASPVIDIADFLLRWQAGYSFKQVEPLADISDISPRPILLIHGTKDNIISYHDSEMLYEAAQEPKSLWIIQNAEHCSAYFMDRPGYCTRVSGFLKEHLPASSAEISTNQEAS